MTRPSTAEKRPRRRFAPRFSLGMLMLAVTAAAVATAFWWRWPVTQTTEKKQGSSITRETFTYHRGLRGNLIKNGVHRISRDGIIVREEFFRENQIHGPFRQSWGQGLSTGEFYLGEKHGTWKRLAGSEMSPAQILRVEEHWNRGKRDGLFQRWDETGKLCLSFEFKDDRLIASQNCPSANLLVQRIEDGTLNDQALPGASTRTKSLIDALFSDIDLGYAETPLAEVVEDIHERFATPFAMRWKRKTVVLPQPRMPVDPPLPAMHEIPFSDEWILLEPDNLRSPLYLVDMRPRNLAPPVPPPPIVEEIQLAPVTVKLRQTPLIVGIDAILAPLGLVLDYRHGVLCIVDAEGAADWKDATGVNDLHPAAGTALAEQLDAQPNVTCLEPLRDVLHNLATTQGIAVEFRPADDPASGVGSIPAGEMANLFREAVMIRDEPATRPIKPIPITLRQLLGLLLDQGNLQCHEENGVLIIEPQLGAAGASARVLRP